MKKYKPVNPAGNQTPDEEVQPPKKQNQDDPNKLQKPGGLKEKYVQKPLTKGIDEENPGRDYDHEG